jgi:hypothetical protein
LLPEKIPAFDRVMSFGDKIVRFGYDWLNKIEIRQEQALASINLCQRSRCGSPNPIGIFLGPQLSVFAPCVKKAYQGNKDRSGCN